MEKYYLFYVLAFVAEVIGTISGFGSSILFVPLATLFFDFKVVLGITAIFHVFSNLSKIYLFRQGINKHIAWRLGVAAVIFVIIGAWLSNVVPQKELELMMSVLLVALSIVLLLFSDATIAQSNRNLVAGGVVSGFLAGLIGTGGAIRGLTLMAFNLEKSVFIATSSLIDLGVDFSRAVVYCLNGYVQKEYLFILPILLVVSIVGSWTGKQLLQYVSQRMFRYLVLGVIILTSIVQVYSYFKNN